ELSCCPFARSVTTILGGIIPYSRRACNYRLPVLALAWRSMMYKRRTSRGIMETLFQYVAPPSRCGYLPDRLWSLEYELLAGMTPADYQRRLLAGWRRFGSMVFRPRCQACTACQSLRVIVDRFRPNRSQRRADKLNAGQVELRVGPPAVAKAK